MQIGKLSVDSASFCGGCEGNHHTELLERRFHGFSFEKMTLTVAPAAEGIISSSFLLYWRQVIARSGCSSGLRPFYVCDRSQLTARITSLSFASKRCVSRNVIANFLVVLHRWLLLDSRVVDLPRAYNLIFVML